MRRDPVWFADLALRRAPGAVRRAWPPPVGAAPVRSRSRRVLRLVRRAAAPPLSSTALPRGPVRRPGVRAAVVAGERVRAGLAPEWDQVEPAPADLGPLAAALVLVESGDDALPGWLRTVGRERQAEPALRALLDRARASGTPTVLWSTTPGAAAVARDAAIGRLVDRVATVDAAAVPAWAELLGADRVLVAAPAAQPRIADPVGAGGPTPAARRPYEASLLLDEAADAEPAVVALLTGVLGPVLAGGVRVWRRTVDGEPVADVALPGSRPWSVDARYSRLARVPARSRLLIDAVAPGRQVPTWRLLEAGAAATPVVSTPYGDGLAPELGAALTVADEPESYRLAVTAHIAQPELRDRAALRLQRAVLAGHTYRHRVDALLAAAGVPPDLPPPSVSAIVSTRRPQQLDAVLADVARQSHRPLELVLVLHGLDLDPADVARRAHQAGIEHVQVLAADPSLTLGACLNLGVDAASGRYLAKLDDDDVYGEHYLQDLVAAFDYTTASVVGKWAHYVALEQDGAVALRFPAAEHSYQRLVQGGTLVVDADLLRSLRFADLPRGVDTDLLDRVQRSGALTYSADRFNFVSVRRSDKSGHTYRASDAVLLAPPTRLDFYGDPRAHVEV